MSRTANATRSNSTTHWQALDRQHHLHPFTEHRNLAEVGARIIVRAEGPYLWDSDGCRLLDAFAGPGMTGGAAPVWAVSQKAADLLIAAGAGSGSPTGDWVRVALVTAGALAAAFAVFVASARSRS